LLERIVEVITSNSKLWVDTMLTEELGLQLDGPHPLRAALATFFSFVIVGLATFLPNFDPAHRFVASAIVTAAAFFAVGTIKGVVLERRLVRSGLETFLTGGGAAVLAYLAGIWLRHAYGVS
jgi:VIT1/CCC1 family predicted Fe2+/Mn2+ transporter